MPNAKTTIALEYPFPENRVFRYQAMQDVLSALIEEPFAEVSVSNLAARVDADQSTVSKAVTLLGDLGVVETRPDGRKELVSINRTRLNKPDPVLSISQPEFQRPVRAFLDRLESSVDDIVGVVLFGSVAMGEADRMSDIDLLVIVDGDKTQTRRDVQSIVRELENQKFEGNRYSFQTLVESTESAKRIGDRLRDQFDDAITLIGSEELAEIREGVYTDGQ
ncbi:MAG: nucleotidyltransferase domain-containing protein [Halopenitus sp.]